MPDFSQSSVHSLIFITRKIAPIHRSLPWFLQICIGLREVFTTQEPTVGWQRWRVNSFQHMMLLLQDNQSKRKTTKKPWDWKQSFLNTFSFAFFLGSLMMILYLKWVSNRPFIRCLNMNQIHINPMTRTEWRFYNYLF